MGPAQARLVEEGKKMGSMMRMRMLNFDAMETQSMELEGRRRLLPAGVTKGLRRSREPLVEGERFSLVTAQHREKTGCCSGANNCGGACVRD